MGECWGSQGEKCATGLVVTAHSPISSPPPARGPPHSPAPPSKPGSPPHPRIEPSVAAAAASPGRPERRRRRRGGDVEVSWPGPRLGRSSDAGSSKHLPGPRPPPCLPVRASWTTQPAGTRLTCGRPAQGWVAWRFGPEQSVMGPITLMTPLWRPPSLPVPRPRVAPSRPGLARVPTSRRFGFLPSFI